MFRIHKATILTVLMILFFIATSRVYAADFRFGFEQGVLLPIDSSLYDNRNSIPFPGFKEGMYWTNGWGIEFSQRLISPQNRSLGFGISTGHRVARGSDRYHLQYSIPLVLSLRYDFKKSEAAFFRPYIAGGLGLYRTVRTFERIQEEATVIEETDAQSPLGTLFTVGMKLRGARVDVVAELKYELFKLKETFEGSGDQGTGGGTSVSIGIIF